ncbi:MAG: ATP-binding protein, partial [Thermoanaerobaculia bacterium]|nr:ATP-binding protein [Thermoanaerobaculia bacterium]
MPGKRHEILIRGFTQTPDGTAWIASGQGLGKLDPQTLQFGLFTARDGLAETELMGIACDQKGRLWLKGLTSIIRYDPKLRGTKAFKHYPVGKDMLEMNTVGALACRDGRILMHGNKGLYAFHPDSIWCDTIPPKVVLVDFSIPDSSIHFGKATELVTDIRIPAGSARIFTFEFAALYFIDPEHVRYQYRLEGFRDEWLDIGTDRKVTFTNLRPGAYTFRVRSCNADGVCSGEKEELVIRLQVLPPWWASWWAYLSYLLLLAIIVQLIFRFRLRQKMARLESLRLQELDRFKTRFYTNITHEFRTPLTLILGPVSGALNKKKSLGEDELHLVKRNAERLLQLIDQLLQLSKLDAGVLKPDYTRADLIPFLRYLLESFHSYAEGRGIRLEFSANVETLVLDFDKEKWQTIVSNLLSNALKFTPPGSGGRVELRLEAGEKNLRISVRDNGPGIPAEKLPFLFDRFYQAGAPESVHPGGAGIGLALTKELVELLGGTIAVESAVGVGSAFVVAFPALNAISLQGNKGAYTHFILREGPFNSPGVNSSSGILPSPEKFGTGLLILIIEDHPEAARYIASCLGPAFKTILAPDGKQGLDRAFELIPDLIICDVMMPEKDGYEVCRTLKRDDRTSHIPIILLTAKADPDSRLEGFEQGADAYLSKPFNETELRVRVAQMIEQRQRMQEHYRKAFLADPSGPEKIPPPENPFLQKLNAILEQRYADHRFSVEALARSAAMSQPQLHRKLSALTGRSAGAFIRDFRLQKARALLTHSDLNISEIAYDCGFSAPAHFTRAFGEAFGASPSGYRAGRRKSQ